MSTYSPRARIITTPLGDDLTGLSCDLSDDIISVATHKGYGETGDFLITLPPASKFGELYESLIRPGHLLHIEFDEGTGKGFVITMVGMVSSVEASFQVTGAQHIKRVVVHGQDLKKILDTHHCFYFGAIKKDNAGSGVGIKTYTNLQYGSAAYIGKLPAAVIPLILENELYQHLPWVSSYIRADRLANSGWAVAIQGVTPSNTVWSALKMAADEPFNKLHCDTDADGLVHLTLEKCPFNNMSGKLERTLTTIQPEEVVSTNIGANDSDRVNYIWHKVNAALYNSPDGSPLVFLEGDTIQYEKDKDKDTIKIHGFRPWYPESRSNPFANSEEANVPTQLQDAPVQIKIVADRTLAFWNWYRRNHEYLSGTMVVHGRTDLKAGGGISLHGYEYLIESINHQFTITNDGKPSYLASMHVTRGQKT